jgi:hypothetical protein
VDQGAPGPAVAVDERMDRLELRVCDCGLRDRGERILVAERAQIFEQVGHILGGRRHERGRARIVTAAADPVLLGA